jgi:hypothetical protein
LDLTLVLVLSPPHLLSTAAFIGSYAIALLAVIFCNAETHIIVLESKEKTKEVSSQTPPNADRFKASSESRAKRAVMPAENLGWRLPQHECLLVNIACEERVNFKLKEWDITSEGRVQGENFGVRASMTVRPIVAIVLCSERSKRRTINRLA